jgi:Ca2+ transporting ATPase
MVTGDNLETAKSIAFQAGILSKEDLTNKYSCITGEHFKKIIGGCVMVEDSDGHEREGIKNVHKFKKLCKEMKVLARATPIDKHILVTGL